jgi:hypothetical protein
LRVKITLWDEMQRLSGLFADLVTVIGAGLVVYGVHTFNPGAAWIIGGMFCVFGGLMIGAGSGNR